MTRRQFAKVSIHKGHPKWDECISREKDLYKKKADIRDDFERDYTRILHCTAYRRLKHKTQVFPAPNNDHVCTRIEHVNHVASVSHSISNYLGLNTQLTAAIAIGHDLGHAPFGHSGEEALKEIARKEIGETFWHEKNSLRFVDKIETLPDIHNNECNLDLTYAVRDGIICHCGEVDENAIRPRSELIDLQKIDKPSKYLPYTWEGCVVKIADKISYLGRDIEDAIMLGILSLHHLKELRTIVKVPINQINNTVLMHDFIINLCKNSNPEKGICFSDNYLEFINLIKKFNYQNIYHHERLKNYKKYVNLIIESIFEAHKDFYEGKKTLSKLDKIRSIYPRTHKVFNEWLRKYSNCDKRGRRYRNELLYDITNDRDYLLAVIEYISGMTDNFAINIFSELITFK